MAPKLITKERLRKAGDIWHTASLVLWVLFIVVLISQKFKDVQYTFLAAVIIFSLIPCIPQILRNIIHLPNMLKSGKRKPGIKPLRSQINFRSIIRETFQMLLVLFLLALLAQQFNPDLIDRYMNISYFLVAVIVSGVLTILTQKEESCSEEVKEKPTLTYYLFVIFMGILGAFLIWYKLRTMDISYVPYLISGLGGVLIILLSILVSFHMNDNTLK
ncbi:MAG: hypothetical protein A7315_08245 [Candidatus Altiarchaeales archaeon WOR_SM1_79]|nr:MAG: hypothetical protein A7315_08245 [Candidatus Altiarchaeales archaeon WOR_SM1_79]